MSWSCNRRSRLNASAMLSKVSSTFGLSSASIAASDIEFSRSSSSRSASAIAASSPPSSPSPRRGCGLNGVAPGGADGGATVCTGCGTKPPLPAGMPCGPILEPIGAPIAAATPDGSPPGYRRRDLLGVGAGIGRFEIDDVAEEDFSFVQLIAPDDDGLERQRALAQAGDHGLAAGLDALGDGDFAFARQKLDRTHFPQIHAHRIVGALGRLLGFGLGGRSWG